MHARLPTPCAPRQPSSIGRLHLNGDGWPDLVATISYAGSVWVSLGKGDGTFACPVEYLAAGGAHAFAVVDVDGDGKLDVVTQDGYEGISVLIGKGDGTLASRVDFPVYARALSFGDMNSDGALDLIAGSRSNAVNVLLGACR